MDDSGNAEPIAATPDSGESNLDPDVDAIPAFQTFTTLLGALAKGPTIPVLVEDVDVVENGGISDVNLNYLNLATAFATVAVIDFELIATAMAPKSGTRGIDQLIILVCGNTSNTSPAFPDLQTISRTVHPDPCHVGLQKAKGMAKKYLEHGW